MKKEEIQALFSQFEQASCVTNDIECWSARELCSLLGYTQWRNFLKVIDKAKKRAKMPMSYRKRVRMWKWATVYSLDW